MPQLSLHMFVNIIGHENLNIDDTIQFILSVKKSYRDNPYHNFEHAFNVCHCMFNMLNRNMDQFSAVEVSHQLIIKIISLKGIFLA